MKYLQIKHLYRVEIFGVQFTDEENDAFLANEFPLLSNLYDDGDRWIDDLKTAINQFDSIKPSKDEDIVEYDGLLKRIQHVEILIPQFEVNWDLDFNLDKEEVQDAIPYEVDFNLNAIQEEFTTL